MLKIRHIFTSGLFVYYTLVYFVYYTCILHALPPTAIISTKFEVDMTVH